MAENTTTTETFEDITDIIENIDEFIPMPDADTVVTGTGNDGTKDKNIFKQPKEEDLAFLDEASTSEETKAKLEVQATLESLDDNLTNTDTQEDKEKTAGRKKIDKSGLVDTFSKLIEDGVMFGFDDEKLLEDYTVNDFKELIQANFDEREKVLKEQTPKEFFDSLPNELQYAAAYVAKGGKDLKGLFQALAQTEEVKALDLADETSHEAIVRQYLQASKFGGGDVTLIEDQMQEWLEAGTIGKKASQFKPKLDEMQEEILSAKIQQAETHRLAQEEKKEAYMRNIYDTLKPADLNGIKLDAKRQKFLWDELTTLKYQSLSGRQTNLLGSLLEEYQFGKVPRYDLIAEATWLLSNPEDYKEQIRKSAVNKNVQDTVRSLKTEQGRVKLTTTQEEEASTTRKITRQSANIFKRS